MTFILNLLWLLLGGVWLGLGWMLAALLMVLTIVGIPWARAAFTIGVFAFAPFGRMAVDRRIVTGHADIGTGPLGLLGNVIWFLFAGWWLALGHLAAAVLLAVTVIGIPFALQHFKLALLAVAPIGQEIVSTDS